MRVPYSLNSIQEEIPMVPPKDGEYGVIISKAESGEVGQKMTPCIKMSLVVVHSPADATQIGKGLQYVLYVTEKSAGMAKGFFRVAGGTVTDDEFLERTLIGKAIHVKIGQKTLQDNTKISTVLTYSVANPEENDAAKEYFNKKPQAPKVQIPEFKKKQPVANSPAEDNATPAPAPTPANGEDFFDEDLPF